MNDSNNDSEMAKSESEVYKLYAPLYFYSQYLSIFWLVVGLFGNILSFLVWISPRVRKENSSAVYLAALSVADLSLLICTVLVHLNFMFDIQPIYDRPILCEIYTIPYIAAQYMSSLLVLAFTIERWIAICFPFRRDTLCTTKRACVVVACLSTVTLGLCVPHSTSRNFKDGECRSDLSGFIKSYTIAIEVLMACGVPICTLICNILVIRELRRIHQRNKSMSICLMDRSETPTRPDASAGGDSGGNFKATTAMLLSVSFFLIFTTIPSGMVFALQFFILPGPMNASYDSAAWDPFFSLASAKGVFDQVTLSHYACNFFIYLSTGKVFRRHLHRQLMRSRCWRFLCRCCVGPNVQTDSAIVYSAVRHSIHADHRPSRICLDNGNARNAIPFPARSNRRPSARSSAGSTAASLDTPNHCDNGANSKPGRNPPPVT